MKRLRRILLAPATIITLITAVGAASLMGTIIPQSADKTPRFLSAWQAANPLLYKIVKLLQLDRIYTSVWFLALIAIITCSLCCSLYGQLQKALKSPDFDPGSNTVSVQRKAICSFFVWRTAAAAETIIRLMKKRGYHHSPAESADSSLLFNKNKIGRWGGIIFHCGLLCILLAGLWNMSLRQRGLAILTVGDNFNGQTGRWANTRTGISAGPFRPQFTISLDKFQPQYWNNDQIKSLFSEVTIVEQGGKSVIVPISVNNPGHVNGIKLFLSGDYGYALDLLLNSNSAHPVLAHILLDVPASRQETATYDMTIPTTAYRLHINFHPDRQKPSMLLTSPAADLTVSVPGEPPFRAIILPGQSIVLPLGDTLTFNKVSYWTGIIFAKSYGIPLLYAGFGLCIIGAFLLYALPVKVAYMQISAPTDQQRDDYGRVQQGVHGALTQQISLSGRTRRYQALFDQELQEIAAEIQEAAPIS
ncbi:cytochrome c biogenesis protein ResB [Desulfobacterota bacterium M19]